MHYKAYTLIAQRETVLIFIKDPLWARLYCSFGAWELGRQR
jgi:hypothetical protein